MRCSSKLFIVLLMQRVTLRSHSLHIAALWAMMRVFWPMSFRIFNADRVSSLELGTLESIVHSFLLCKQFSTFYAKIELYLVQ